jgi:serine protease Do
MNEEQNKQRRSLVNYLIIFFVGCLAMYAVVYFFPTSITENVTKLEKDVTVTDTGIADAVEKVYNAVVVVSTYKDQTYIASGTGFVYKKDANKYYILTNHHVIDGGNKVTVTFTNGDVIETTVIGSDQYADIAVLLMESKEELTVAPLGKSENTRVGDTAFAVGAPLDSVYSWTVTRGILSGKDRMVEVSLDNSIIVVMIM